MFKKILSLSLLGLLVIPITSCALEQDCKQDMLSTISVSGAKQKEIAPDTAVIRFYVENSGLNLNELKSQYLHFFTQKGI